MSKPRPGQRPAPPVRRKTQFPLDPSYLVQRPLTGAPLPEVPVARIRTTTRSTTIFRKRIEEVDSRAQHGDLVRVIAGEDELVGFGLWNPRAEAAVRILFWEEPENEGRWWSDRLRSAVELRKNLLRLDRVGNVSRLLNAEGDGVPGLTADRYADVISVEAFSLGMFQRAAAIAESLKKLTGAAHWTVRPGPQTLDQEGFVAEGFGSSGAPQKVEIEEHQVHYEVHPLAGQKTGFFCDQRDNRLRIRDFCGGRSVLDVCCYAGGFALNATRAGAQEVTAVDLDEEAIRLARRNAQLNKASVKFVHADAFSYLRDMQRNGRTFDTVILDPPKLIRGREEWVDGQNKYFDLNKLAASIVAPGGILVTCSCSGLLSADEFTRTVRAATAERRPELLFRSGASPDHPVSLGHLETEYLKCMWLRMPE